MIKERYCSLELSKLLKEKGSDEKTFAYYDDDLLCNGFWFEWNRSPLGQVSAPTHQMACDWLRNKGYHIEIYTNASGYRFIISKTPPYGTDLVCHIKGDNDGGAWDDYDDCVESAMKHCLTELMKGDKA